MKEKILSSAALALMLLVGTNMYAKSWRVNSITSRGAKFVDINAAMNSSEVQDGDTLYLDPGSNFSNQQNVTKQVTIIGNGFFHHLSQPYVVTTISGELVLKSAFSKIEGVILKGGCNISANNVTVERCNINGYGIYSNGNNCKNASIRNCYINTTIKSGDYVSGITGLGGTSSITECWTIENNIILGGPSPRINNLYSANILNNLILINYTNNYSSYSISQMNNSYFINNIIINQQEKNKIFTNLSDCVVQNNILSCEENLYKSYPNNKCLNSNDLANLFSMNGNNDLDYILCENSPAKGYATDGGDCGPYGSGYTYVPGGLPYGIPYYTEANIATVDHDGKIKVSLKIAIIDE